MTVLEEAGLITRTKHGRTVWCRLNPVPLRNASDWMDRNRKFWDARFDDLARHLQTKRRGSDS